MSKQNFKVLRFEHFSEIEPGLNQLAKEHTDVIIHQVFQLRNGAIVVILDVIQSFPLARAVGDVGDVGPCCNDPEHTLSLPKIAAVVDGEDDPIDTTDASPPDPRSEPSAVAGALDRLLGD